MNAADDGDPGEPDRVLWSLRRRERTVVACSDDDTEIPSIRRRIQVPDRDADPPG